MPNPQAANKTLIAGRYRLIPACDMDAATLHTLVQQTHDLEGIGGYKVGFRLALEIGLPRTVEIIREFTNKPIIYDHQKAATDIPDTGAMFVEICKKAGIDAVIYFPLTGPRTLAQWLKAAEQLAMPVIVGGIMTHAQFLVSEGGFIADAAATQIYVTAADLGVRDFVVPATKLSMAWGIYEMLKRRGCAPIFYSPGVGAQGASWADLIRADGPPWHAIAGRALLNNNQYRQNAEQLIAQSIRSADASGKATLKNP